MSAAAEVRADRTGEGSVVVLTLAGVTAVGLLARTAPSAPGAARLASPEILLSIFDTLWLLAVLLPRRASLAAAAVVVACGTPFHLAVAAALGAGAGFHAAWASALLASAAAAQAGTRLAPRAYGFALALAAVLLPLASYSAGDFGGADVHAFLAASPLVAPTLLARAARSAVLADALPLVATAAVIALTAALAPRRARGGAA